MGLSPSKWTEPISFYAETTSERSPDRATFAESHFQITDAATKAAIRQRDPAKLKQIGDASKIGINGCDLLNRIDFPTNVRRSHLFLEQSEGSPQLPFLAVHRHANDLLFRGDGEKRPTAIKQP